MKLDLIKCPWKIWRQFVIKEDLKTFCYRNPSCCFLVRIFLAIDNLLTVLSWEQCRWVYPEIWVLEKTFRFSMFDRKLTPWYLLWFATAWNFALPDFRCFSAKVTVKVLRRKRDIKYLFQYFLVLVLRSCYSYFIPLNVRQCYLKTWEVGWQRPIKAWV